MKIFNYIKTINENKNLKEENLNLYRANADLLETAREYKTRNLKKDKIIKALKEKMKEVEQ